MKKKKTGPPPNTTFKRRQDGTLVSLKGDNLAGDFAPGSKFQTALKQKDRNETAFLWLERYKDFLKLNNPREEFRIEKVTSDELGGTHVKLQQVAGGIPVWGKTILLHYNKANAIYLFQGDYAPVSLFSGVNTVADIPVSEAEARAVAAASGDPSMWHTEGHSMAVFLTSDNSPRLAYALTLTRGLAQRYLYMVDAADGRILHKISLVRTGAAPMQLK